MKVVLQDGIKDCGICSLLSIVRFYGGEVSKEYLREITNTTKDGVSFYNLIEVAKKIGFDAIGLSGNIEDIDVNNLPCIAHFIINKSYKHFVVLYDFDKKKKQVTLMDPAKGKKIISISEFNLLSSNNYIFLKPIKKLPIMQKKNIIYKNIIELFKMNKKLLLSIVILTFSYFTFNVLTSFHFKYLLEYSINYNLTKNIYYLSIIMIVFYFFKNSSNLLRNILLSKWTIFFDNEITTNTYRQLLLLPYLYYKNRTTGEVISRFKDLNTIRSFINRFFCIISTDLISIIIFFIIMFSYNKKLTLYLIAPTICLVLYHFLISPKKKKYIKNISTKQDIINSYLIQGISNVDTVKGSHLEKRLIDKFTINYKAFLENIYSYNMLLERYSFNKNLLNDFSLLIIFGLGSYYVIKGNLSLNNLIVYQLFFSYFNSNFHNLISILEEYNSYKVALNRVEEIFMINKDNFTNNYFYLAFTLNGSIIYKNLTYKVGSKFLFKDLNLSIKQGEKILLSGESGSGKSTLMKMLLRYVEVDFDKIKIADIDINHYHLENIRSNITYVTSNEYLFTDTIRNNIILYKDYPDEEVNEVCRICSVDDIVKNNENSYEALIEENGFNFSNGERQRIILARSIIKKSNIYIFDEALAGIDVNREKKILENIFKYLDDKTIIVISHRFNNRKLFDRVLKLEKAKIYEN